MSRSVQVILRGSLENLGGPGEVVAVKAGYARNYLIPKGLAYEATDANLRRIEHEKQKLERQEQEALTIAQEQAKAFEDLSLTFNVRAGEEGKLFGSVGSADVAEKLQEQGLEVDRRQIMLEEPLKELGVFSVPIRLHADVRPEVKVWIVKEE